MDASYARPSLSTPPPPSTTRERGATAKGSKVTSAATSAPASSAKVKRVDEPGATLPGGWDCARIAEYIAGSDVWAPMEVVIALFIFVTCAFSMTRLCRAKEDQYAPVTRAISEEDLVAPEEDVERGPTLEDKRRMLD